MRWNIALFDWDGLLCNSKKDAYAATAHVFNSFSIAAPSLEEFLRSKSVRLSPWEDFYYANGIPKTVAKGEISRRWGSYFTLHNHACALHDGAVELVVACRNMRMKTGIVSASPRDIASELKRWNFPMAMLDTIIRIKDDKRKALMEALAYFGTPPHKVVLCDDTEEDIRIAKELGMGSIGVNTGFDSYESILLAEPDHPKKGEQPIRSLREVQKIFEAMK